MLCLCDRHYLSSCGCGIKITLLYFTLLYFTLHYNEYMNEQCTYLGYVLLEAPREYVLHGPLLSINWLRFCPHLGGPRQKPRRPEEVVYSPNDSCSHFTQCLFPPKVPQQHTRIISYSTSNIIHTYYTSHLYAHLYLLFFISRSHIHLSGSSWQAGCPRLLVSDTLTNISSNFYPD
jgi:hypothetical protein